MLKELTWPELLQRLDEEPGGLMDTEIRQAMEANRADGVILLENQQMDSSHLGEQSCLTYGPECTYRTPEEIEGKWLHDLPSQRQYPVAYAKRPA